MGRAADPHRKPLKNLILLTLLIPIPAFGQNVGANAVSATSVAVPLVLHPTLPPVDALDIIMPPSTTANAIAVRNFAGKTLFAVSGGARPSSNVAQIDTLAAIPIDNANDAYNCFMNESPVNGTVGNCMVIWNNHVVSGAITPDGQYFSEPTLTTTTPFLANLPNGATANLIDLKVNGTDKFAVDSTGTITAMAAETLTKTGNVPVAPGAGKCRTFATAGTNAGTCKIQVVCGTSAVPATLVDNVGGSC